MTDTPVRITKTDLLLRTIESLGDDKNNRPIGIRTSELAAKTGVATNGIQAMLAPHVASGRLCVCKVTAPGKSPQNEYRRGAGVPRPDFRPLAAKQPAPHRATTPQAQVGNSASRHAGAPLETPPAVSAATAPGTSSEQTPKPDAGAALKKEPATRKASAGDVLRLSIDQDGTLQMGDDADPARWVFTPAQVLAIGDFLHATERVWRP